VGAFDNLAVCVTYEIECGELENDQAGVETYEIEDVEVVESATLFVVVYKRSGIGVVGQV